MTAAWVIVLAVLLTALSGFAAWHARRTYNRRREALVQRVLEDFLDEVRRR